jgi:hypothetical protein
MRERSIKCVVTGTVTSRDLRIYHICIVKYMCINMVVTRKAYVYVRAV